MTICLFFPVGGCLGGVVLGKDPQAAVNKSLYGWMYLFSWVKYLGVERLGYREYNKFLIK